MLVDGSYEILSCDDVELGIKRSALLYHFMPVMTMLKRQKSFWLSSLGLEQTLTLDTGLISCGPWQSLMMWRALVWTITL